MRISIWQQFSSNHSSNFTLVGQFDTHEDAQDAAEKVRDIVVQIAEWYEQNRDTIDWQDIFTGEHSASPVEVDIGQQYGIEWPKVVDWLIDAYRPDQLVTVLVTVYDTLLFVSNAGDTYNGPPPFDELIAKLGGDVVVDMETVGIIYVTLTCVAPDSETADTIYQTINSYLEGGSAGKEIPWIAYHDGARAPDAEAINEAQTNYIIHRQAEQQWMDGYQAAMRSVQTGCRPRIYRIQDMGVYQAAMRSVRTNQNSIFIQPNNDQTRAVQQEWQKKRETMKETLPPLSDADQMRVGHLIVKTQVQTFTKDGGVRNDGNQLTFNRIAFLKIATGLPALIAWLIDQGCTGIEYRLEQG